MSSDIYGSARAQVTEALANMAVLKNVKLSSGQRRQLADGVLAEGGQLARMDCRLSGAALLAALPDLHPQACARLPPVVASIDCHLDAVMMSRLVVQVAAIESKNWWSDEVTGIVRRIVQRAKAGAGNKDCLRWPDLPELLEPDYAGRVYGPIVESAGDGSVYSSYWRCGHLHRDPKVGPAMHSVRGEHHGCEYWVEGRLHRPHEDGPAVTYTAYKGFALSGEEYFENGKWHRPSELGPAVTHWDRNGEPVMKLYFENGEHHRDPKDGPAWWHIRDSRTDRTGERPCTEIRYYVRGQPHRDERDGPAWIKRDKETGVLLTEEYWRNGNYHREDGPAIIERSPDGVVIYEAYRRDGGFRDGSEGPSTIHYDPQGRMLAEAWFTGKDSRRRDASEGPGHIGYDTSTGRVRAEFYVDDQYRPAREGPAAVMRDREGNILWEEFWDGERMHVKDPEPTKAEVSAHG